MLNESPHKKSKSNNNVAVNSSEGPTIHELDNADVLSEELFQEEAESLGQVMRVAWRLNIFDESLTGPLWLEIYISFFISSPKMQAQKPKR